MDVIVTCEVNAEMTPEARNALEMVALATALAERLKRGGVTREEAARRAGAIINASWPD